MASAMIASIEARMELASTMEPITPPEALTTAAWRCPPFAGFGLNSQPVPSALQAQLVPDGQTMPCTVMSLAVLFVAGVADETLPKKLMKFWTPSQLLPGLSTVPPVPQAPA